MMCRHHKQEVNQGFQRGGPYLFLFLQKVSIDMFDVGCDLEKMIRNFLGISSQVVVFGEKNVKIQDYVVCDEKRDSCHAALSIFFNELLPNADQMIGRKLKKNVA